jgi:hypothetical protein
VGRKDATGGADTWAVSTATATRTAAVLVEVLAGELTGEFSLNADPGAYAVTGTRGGGEASHRRRGYLAPSALTLDADPGAYAVTGAAAELYTPVFALRVGPGVYTLTGFATGLKLSLRLRRKPGATR